MFLGALRIPRAKIFEGEQSAFEILGIGKKRELFSSFRDNSCGSWKQHYEIPLVVHFEPERYRRHSVGGGIKASFGGVMGGTWLCQSNSQRSNERILFSHGTRTRIWSDSPRQNPKRNDKVKTNTRKDSPPADYQGHQISYLRNAIHQT